MQSKTLDNALHRMKEAIFLTKTNILPAVNALQKAVKLHRRSLTRRIIVRSFDTLRFFVKYCYAPDPVKVAELTSSAVLGALDFGQYCDEIAKLNNENAISYLVKLPEKFVGAKNKR